MAIPVASINNRTLRVNEWGQVTTWLTYSDADGSPAVLYQFYDAGTGAGSAYFWTLDNARHAAGEIFEVDAANLSSVWLRGGSTAGSETMWVRAFDGTDWSTWDTFGLTTIPNTAPVVTINDHSLQSTAWARVSSWLSYSDAEGNAATKYQFYDGGADASSGYFWTSANDHHAAGNNIEVAAADLGGVWLRAGTAGGTETMWVRAFDGAAWGAWDAFNLTTVPNTAPVATIKTTACRPTNGPRSPVGSAIRTPMPMPRPSTSSGTAAAMPAAATSGRWPTPTTRSTP